MTWLSNNQWPNSFSNECLGSYNDEERSEMRYVMRIARSASHQNFERSLHFLVECVCWSVCGSPTHLSLLIHRYSRRALSPASPMSCRSAFSDWMIVRSSRVWFAISEPYGEWYEYSGGCFLTTIFRCYFISFSTMCSVPCVPFNKSSKQQKNLSQFTLRRIGPLPEYSLSVCLWVY